MWCLRVHRMISAYLDRELDAGTTSRVSKHLERCRWCRSETEKVVRGASLAREARDSREFALNEASRPSVASFNPTPATLTVSGIPLWYVVPAAAAVLLAITFTLSDTRIRSWLGSSGSVNTVYALDFGFDVPAHDEDLLNAFRARYEGKFREFEHHGDPQAGWVPFEFKYPGYLAPGMRLKSVMVFDPKYCGSLGLIFSDGFRNLYLVQQSADHPISLSGMKTTTEEVCKYNATHGTIGPYNLLTWTDDDIRSVLLSNLDRSEIETTVASLKYVGK